MDTVRTTFNKNWVEITAKYQCSCGHKFTRKNREWFTMSPFNTKSYKECYTEQQKECATRIRQCPKCQKELTPSLQ